jgi:DNA-directed RNA polymerase specialized sigma24 family protein
MRAEFLAYLQRQEAEQDEWLVRNGLPTLRDQRVAELTRQAEMVRRIPPRDSYVPPRGSWVPPRVPPTPAPEIRRKFTLALVDDWDAESAIAQKQAVAILLRRLAPRYERVIRLRFGIPDGREHTLKEIGDQMSLSVERIRSMESKALRVMRRGRLHHKVAA